MSWLAVIIYPHLIDKETEATRGPAFCPSNRASGKRKFVNLKEIPFCAIQNSIAWAALPTSTTFAGELETYWFWLALQLHALLTSLVQKDDSGIYYFEHRHTPAPAPSCVVRLETMPPVALCALPSHYSPSLEHNHFLCCPKVSLQGACSIVSAVSAYLGWIPLPPSPEDITRP